VTLPADLLSVTLPTDCAGSPVVCTIGDLAPKASWEQHITGQVLKLGTLSVTAEVATTTAELVTSNNTATPVETIVSSPPAPPAPPAPEGAIATGKDTSSTPGGKASATAGPITGTGTGTGTVTTWQLGSAPKTPAPGAGPKDYFRVSTSPESTFSTVELRVNNPDAGSLFWFDGTTWHKFTGTTRDPKTGELVTTITGSTTPGLGDLSALQVAAGLTPSVRLGGENRLETAVAVSKDAYAAKGSAKSAVLAADWAFADALTGGPLSAAKAGPLLLTKRSSLPATVSAELVRVLPKGSTVYILGETGAVDAHVAAAVKALGYQVVRLGGADRYATSIKIAQALGNPSVVFEASGLDFPDAMSAGPAAITSKGAVLLTKGSKQSSATQAYLAGRTTKRYAVGGQAAAADASATHLVGRDRHATSALVAQRFFPKPESVGVAVGNNFPDALVAAPYLGAKGDPLLLADQSKGLASSVTDYLTAHSSGIGQVTVFGGTASVSAQLLHNVQLSLP
jgi:hypothetical protein